MRHCAHALKGLSTKGTNDLGRIEDVLNQLLTEVDVLKSQTVRAGNGSIPAQSTGNQSFENVQPEMQSEDRDEDLVEYLNEANEQFVGQSTRRQSFFRSSHSSRSSIRSLSPTPSLSSDAATRLRYYDDRADYSLQAASRSATITIGRSQTKSNAIALTGDDRDRDATFPISSSSCSRGIFPRSSHSPHHYSPAASSAPTNWELSASTSVEWPGGQHHYHCDDASLRALQAGYATRRSSVCSFSSSPSSASSSFSTLDLNKDGTKLDVH